jgi:hypothetical protein
MKVYSDLLLIVVFLLIAFVTVRPRDEVHYRFVCSAIGSYGLPPPVCNKNNEIAAL